MAINIILQDGCYRKLFTDFDTEVLRYRRNVHFR